LPIKQRRTMPINTITLERELLPQVATCPKGKSASTNRRRYMNTPESIAYTAKAEITGGRDGHGATDDKMVDVDLRTPKEQGGPGGGANPEQLFAVGYGACFQGAMGWARK